MRPTLLPMTRPLLHWLRADPRWSELPWSQRSLMTWHAHLGSLNARLSAGLDGPQALPAPVLVLGPWRSGTTVMHELLVAATGYPSPRTWHCMNAPAFRLRGGSRGEAAPRPMDGLPIGADSPQEDEFALLSLGVDSAYRGFLQPWRLAELRQTLDPAYWLQHAADWLPAWHGFLRNVAVLEGKAAQAMVLKSPNHSFRLKALLQAHPDCRIVWMCRDPSEVLHSNRKMWTHMMERYALGARDAALLDEFLLLALERCGELIQQVLSGLPPDRMVACAQEDLQQHPEAVVAAICHRLNLPLNPVQLAQARQRLRGGRIEHYPAMGADPRLAALQQAQARLLGRSGWRRECPI